MTTSVTSLAAVLADHARGDWSDHTYSCQGCRDRVEAEVDAAWPDADPDEQRALRARFHQAMKPDWTREQYHAHVADAVLAYLTELAADKGVLGKVADAVADVRDSYPRRADDADSEEVADAAVAAFLAELGGTDA